MSILEIAVLSVDGLRRYSSPFTALFSTPISCFITLSKIPPTNADKPSQVYNAQVPTWAHKFRVPLDPTFFSDTYSSLRLQLYTKRRIVGLTQLGWCLIPASDIGFLPSGSLRYLSYGLRQKDGSRGHGIINLSIRLEGFAPSTVDACRTVIGMPVTAIRGFGDYNCDCEMKSGKGSKGRKVVTCDGGGARQR